MCDNIMQISDAYCNINQNVTSLTSLTNYTILLFILDKITDQKLVQVTRYPFNVENVDRTLICSIKFMKPKQDYVKLTWDREISRLSTDRRCWTTNFFRIASCSITYVVLMI
jgi:hypothetical protein